MLGCLDDWVRLTLFPIRKFTNVDFPAFGAPSIAIVNDLGFSGCTGGFRITMRAASPGMV